MSKAYAFSLGQRVNVPGQDGVQGLISAPTHTGEMHQPITGVSQQSIDRHVYLVRYLIEDGESTYAWFGDFDLTFANPEPKAQPIERATVIATLSDAVAKITARRKGKGSWVASDPFLRKPLRFGRVRNVKPSRKSKFRRKRK